MQQGSTGFKTSAEGSFDSLISGDVQLRFRKPQCQQSSDNLEFLSSEKKFHAQYMLNLDEM